MKKTMYLFCAMLTVSFFVSCQNNKSVLKFPERNRVEPANASYSSSNTEIINKSENFKVAIDILQYSNNGFTGEAFLLENVDITRADTAFQQ